MAKFGTVLRIVVSMGVISVMSVSPVFAQTTSLKLTDATSNKDFVYRLFFTDNVVVAGTEDPNQIRALADSSAKALAKFVSTALSTAPAASSSAGFSYVRNQTTGERSFKSQSYGATFADRPLTNGKGVLNLGFSYQFGATDFAGAFDTADGRDIGLPITDNVADFTDAKGGHQYITVRGFLQTTANSYLFSMAYGLSDRVDVGVLVPVVSLGVRGYTERAWDITRDFNESHPPGFPTAVGTSIITPEANRSVTGLGDVTLRTKFSLWGRVEEGGAIAADLRLPTGDEEELLGTGETGLRLQLLLLKSGFGPASIHANAGYAFGGAGNEFDYVAGVETVLLSSKRLTASASLLGRVLQEGADPITTMTWDNFDEVPTPLRKGYVNRFDWQETTLNFTQIAAGIKYHLGGQWLLSASALIPISRRGYQPKIAPMFGLEKTWTR